MKIAVCLFTYNRPRYLKRVIKTHKKVDGLKYYAFLDKSENQSEIIDIVESVGFYNLIVRKYKHGLNGNIRGGIDFAFEMGNDAVIVLEDDLLLSSDAIWWLGWHLGIVRDFTIAGNYSYGAVSLQEPTKKFPFRCWGWGTWKDVWRDINWFSDESWDIVVNENFKRKNLISYGSVPSRVKHIGTWGVHYNLIGYLKEKFR